MQKTSIPRLLPKDGLTVALLLLIGALMVSLIIKGYPLPYCDDLAVIGAALNLAKSGEFSNPYVREWMEAFPATKPYFYPPGLSYLLGSWLTAFGISVGSVVSFQWIAICTLSLSTFYFLRAICKQPVSVALVAAMSFLLAFQLDGMRGETVAYAMGMTGTCLALLDKKALRTAGYFMLAFSGVVYPVAPFLFMPIFLAGYLTSDLGTGASPAQVFRHMLKELPLALPGAATSLALFLLMIEGEWEDFFRVITIHKNAAIPGGIREQLNGYWHISTAYSQVYIRLPLTILSCCAVGYGMVNGLRGKSRDWILPTLLLVACLISIISNPMRARNLVPVLQIIILLVSFSRVRHLHHLCAPFIGIIFIGIINLKLLLGLFLQEPADPSSLAKMRKAASKIDYSNTKVYSCSWAARHIFSYNIPPSIVDIATWSIVPKLHHNKPVKQLQPSKIGDQEIWLLSDDIYFTLPKCEKSCMPKPLSASLFGIKIPNIMAKQAGPCMLRKQPSASKDSIDPPGDDQDTH